MSIINDALKKTQLNLKRPKRKQKKEAEAPQDNGPKVSNVYEKLYKNRQEQQDPNSKKIDSKQKSTSKKKDEKQKSRLSSYLKIFISLVCVLAIFIFLKNYQPLQDALESKLTSSSSRKPYQPRPATKKRRPKPGELILNGISTIDGKKVALINDEIYEIGGSINGKEIINIGVDRVELTDNRKIFTIKVR